MSTTTKKEVVSAMFRSAAFRLHPNLNERAQNVAKTKRWGIGLLVLAVALATAWSATVVFYPTHRGWVIWMLCVSTIASAAIGMMFLAESFRDYEELPLELNCLARQVYGLEPIDFYDLTEEQLRDRGIVALEKATEKYLALMAGAGEHAVISKAGLSIQESKALLVEMHDMLADAGIISALTEFTSWDGFVRICQHYHPTADVQ